MMKVCVIRLWLSAVLLAGLLPGAAGSGLRAQSPGSAGRASPSAAKTSPDNQKLQLKQAANLADAGKYSAAMAIYRRVFGTHPPPGDLAVAYYETEAATDGGRANAAEGLRGLVERFPADSRYQISLGRVLTYDPETREEGRRYLAKFPDDPKAGQALRQSLVWDAANPAAAPEIRAFLATHPDPQLTAVYQLAQPSAAKTDAAAAPDIGSKTGVQADSSPGDSSTEIVVTPASSRAAASAQQAASPYPAGAQPETKAQAGAAAVPAASQSASVPPADGGSASPRVAAQAAADQAPVANRISSVDELDQTAARYKQAIAADSSNSAAWESLANLEVAAGHDQDALQTIQQMPSEVYASAMHTPKFEITVASLYERLKNFDQAQAILQNAVTEQMKFGQEPSPAIELQLADIYAERGKPQLAYPVYQQLLRENPDSVDAWAGLLSALHVTGHDSEAVEQVDLIPADARQQLESNQFYLQTMAAVYESVARLGTAAHVQTGVEPDAQAAVRSASVPTAGQAPGEESQTTQGLDAQTKPPSVAAAAVYAPFVPYVAPATRPARETGYQPGPTSASTVQLGNDTPHPVRAQAEITDVLPTERYGPSARSNQAAASQTQVAAAREERIQRLQQDAAAARSGQSHPPPQTITGAQNLPAQVPRPASPPAGFGAVPDTGAQQYPQPRTPPGPNGSISRNKAAQSALAAGGSGAAAPRAPTQQLAGPAPAAGVTTQTPASQSPDVSPGAAAQAPSPAIARAAPSVKPQSPLAAPLTVPESPAGESPAPAGPYNSSAAVPLAQPQQAEDELASLEGSYSGWLGATGIGRYRTGTSGLDRLYDLESPAEASVVFRRQLRLTAVAEPVFLNSGTLNPADFPGPNVPYLGTMALSSANLPARQFFNGIGGELQLAAKSFALAVGYAPYEFPVRNVTARFLWNPLGNHVSLFGDRQPVKDTLLSYVGMHDPGVAAPMGQGTVWGGVVASTGGVRLQFGDPAASFFVSGEGGVLTGQHVLDNYRFNGSIGSVFRLHSWAQAGELRLGATITGMHYQHDEVGLSYGQGGYFSPDTYFVGSIPVSFDGHSGANFHYRLAGAVGAQRFQQNAAPFFPLDPELQLDLVALAGPACTSALAATYVCGEYPLLVSTQFNYSFDSEVSYRFADHWYGGGVVSANNSSNFNTVSAGVFFRYVFQAQHSRQGYPAGLFQVDGLRPLQIR